MVMTPKQKIKREILLLAIKDFNEYPGDYEDLVPRLGTIENITEETVDGLYDQLSEAGYASEYESEFRGGDCETGLPSDYSQHYVAKEVAMQCSDGSWIGWTFWYGGGKHGYPSEIEWMDTAYEVEITERQEVVTVREFRRKGTDHVGRRYSESKTTSASDKRE